MSKRLSFRVSSQFSIFSAAAYLALMAGFLGAVAVLFYASLTSGNGSALSLVDSIARWFDPVFFQYNLMLMLLAVLIIPLITFHYVTGMKEEKIRRLKRDLPQEFWTDEEASAYVLRQINESFHIKNYLGSMLALTVIVISGTAVILLLKPMPVGNLLATGVDYSKGANFLMLGPYMDLFIHNNDDYLRILVMTLTAFQFGFLGAYVHFIGHLVRGYFTLDLTPHIFVSSSIRMVTGSLLALVLSYGFFGLVPWAKDAPVQSITTEWLPVVSFFIGFFPSRGIILIEKVSSKLLNIKEERYFSTPLTELSGMSYAHHLRLSREGIDNVENLVGANALDLALRTGFSYRQLREWISQAELYAHMGKDYHPFVAATGIKGMSDLTNYIESFRADHPSDDPYTLLDDATGLTMSSKIRIIGELADRYLEKETTPIPVMAS